MMRTLFVFILFVCITIGLWIRDAFMTSRATSSSTAKLETCDDDTQASLLVSQLEASGINSTVAVSADSKIQAESPDRVDVIVSLQDFDKAKTIMEKWKQDVE